jgi:hypothetical protein
LQHHIVHLQQFKTTTAHRTACVDQTAGLRTPGACARVTITLAIRMSEAYNSAVRRRPPELSLTHTPSADKINSSSSIPGVHTVNVSNTCLYKSVGLPEHAGHGQVAAAGTTGCCHLQQGQDPGHTGHTPNSKRGVLVQNPSAPRTTRH